LNALNADARLVEEPMKLPCVRAALCACLVLGSWLSLAPSPAMAAAADAAAVVTILEGDAVLLRGPAKLAAAGGVLVQPDDILESSRNAFVRLEFEDGAHVDVGPSTRLQVSHPTGARGDRPALYLLAGWLKVSLGDAKLVPPAGLASPLVDGVELTGTLLARVEAGSAALFVEQGRARCSFRGDHAPATLKTGDFLAIARDGKVAVDARPATDFVEKMPSQFRDSIPSQMARYRGRQVLARTLESFSYAEVEAWLNGEASIRQQFVNSWRAKADDAEFRLALTAKLNQHPEWGPVLFPELFAAKPSSGSTAFEGTAAAPAPVSSPPSAPAPAAPGTPPPKPDSGAM
jgi:hypothetical protein